MEHNWEFRSVTNTDEVINAGLCAMQTEVDGAHLVGPQPGWRWCLQSIDWGEDGVLITTYVEREHWVMSTIGWDGRVIG